MEVRYIEIKTSPAGAGGCTLRMRTETGFRLHRSRRW